MTHRRPLVTALLSAGLLTLALAGTGSASAAAHPVAATSGNAAARGVSGDFDGDGRPDLVAGAPVGNQVHVVYSHARVAGSRSVELTPNATTYSGSMRFGSTLAIGNFNHDGYADLAVSAPWYTTAPNDSGSGDGSVESRGAVFIFLGSPSGLHEEPLTLIGQYDGDDPHIFGYSLAAADVNADGYTDLAIGDPYADLATVVIDYGSSTGLHPGPAYTLGGADALAFGDVNGDGHPDLLVGITVDIANTSGELYGGVTVLRGTRHGITAASPERVQGDQVGVSGLGSSIAAGNINGDRYADVVVGADTSDRVGGAVALYGGPHGLVATHHRTIQERSVFAHPQSGDAFGAAVLIGRVRGSRFGDVVLGAPDARVDGRPAVGAIYLLHGARSGVRVAHAQRITPATPGVPGSARGADYFGQALCLLNFNPGHRRLVIGAPGESDGAQGGGMIVSLKATSNGLTAHGARSIGDTTAHDGLGGTLV